jgi:hypothetical protein
VPERTVLDVPDTQSEPVSDFDGLKSKAPQPSVSVGRSSLAAQSMSLTRGQCVTRDRIYTGCDVAGTLQVRGLLRERSGGRPTRPHLNRSSYRSWH